MPRDLSEEIPQKILDELKNAPDGLSFSELARRLEVSINTIAKYAYILDANKKIRLIDQPPANVAKLVEGDNDKA